MGFFLVLKRAGTARVMTLRDEDIVHASEFTRKRELTVELHLKRRPPGFDFVLLVCSYSPRERASFAVEVESSCRMALRRLTPDGFPFEETSINGCWSGVTAGGCLPNHRTWVHNPQYLLTVSGPQCASPALRSEIAPPSHVFPSLGLPSVPPPPPPQGQDPFDAVVVLSQRSTRGIMVDAGCHVLTNAPKEGPKTSFSPAEIVAKTMFGPRPEVACAVRLRAGHRFVLVPSTFSPHQEGEFCLTVFSRVPIDLAAVVRKRPPEPPKQPTKVAAEEKETFQKTAEKGTVQPPPSVAKGATAETVHEKAVTQEATRTVEPPPPVKRTIQPPPPAKRTIQPPPPAPGDHKSSESASSMLSALKALSLPSSAEQRVEQQGRWVAHGPKCNAGGCFPNFPTWRQAPQFSLRSAAAERSRVSLRLKQRTNGGSPIGMGLLACRAPQTKTSRVLVLSQKDILARSAFAESRVAEASLELEEGQRAVVLASTFHPNKEAEFTLMAEGEGKTKVVLGPLPPLHSYSSVRVCGAWKGPNAGGHPQLPSFFSNPQFVLRVSCAHPCEVVVVLSQPGIPTYLPISFLVYRRESGGQGRVNSCAAKECVFKPRAVGRVPETATILAPPQLRFVGGECSLLVIPFAFNKGEESSFEVFAFSEEGTVTLHEAH